MEKKEDYDDFKPPSCLVNYHSNVTKYIRMINRNRDRDNNLYFSRSISERLKMLKQNDNMVNTVNNILNKIINISNDDEKFYVLNNNLELSSTLNETDKNVVENYIQYSKAHNIDAKWIIMPEEEYNIHKNPILKLKPLDNRDSNRLKMLTFENSFLKINKYKLWFIISDTSTIDIRKIISATKPKYFDVIDINDEHVSLNNITKILFKNDLITIFVLNKTYQHINPYQLFTQLLDDSDDISHLYTYVSPYVINLKD
jgi:hypothetical protein